MTKIKAYPFIYFLPAFVMLVSVRGQGDPFIDHLKNNLNEYNVHYYTEKALLMTDRYVYRPGEDLWFKGFVISPSSKTGIAASEDLFVRLLNSRGEEVMFHRYPLENNQADGRLSIPRSCIPGKYWLVAYSGWMKNSCPEEAFRKEILISKYFEKRFHVEVMYDKIFYFTGDTLTAFIKILDPAGKPISETDYNFTIGTLKKTDIKGSGKTDILGQSTIKCLLPNSEAILMLNVEIRTRKYSGVYSNAIPDIAYKPVVSFYPEGGHLIKDLKNSMVIRVTNKYQYPEIVSAVIMDSKGNMLQKINTSAAGMVKFDYIPLEDTCFLKIILPQGILEKYPLPYAREKGTTLHYLDDRADTVRFIVNSTENNIAKIYCVAVMNRNIVWYKILDLSSSQLISIPKKMLGSGILQLTLFNAQQDIIAERLINISEEEKRIKVRMDQQVFHPRQRVSIVIEYPEALKGSKLAMSVSLSSLARNSRSEKWYSLPYGEACIRDREWTGNINPLNDLELRTTSYKNINWREVLDKSPDKEPYYAQDGLSGIVQDKKGNFSQNAKVRITHFPNFRLYETQTDEKGIFHVSFGSDIIDYRFLNIDAYDALGKVNLNAAIDYAYSTRIGEMLIREAQDNNEQQKIADLYTYGEPDLVYVLRYGPGKFRKLENDTRKKYDPYLYANYTNVLDIIQDIQPYNLINDKIYFTGRDKNRIDSTTVKEETLIVINGALKGNDIHALKNLLPSDITNINISKSLLDVHKYTPTNFAGVIEITTIQGIYKYRQSHVQVGTGFLNAEKGFYSPNYSIESSYSADNRRTLYWNPEFPLIQGNSILITFFTSDIKGVYYGRISGIDQDGNPVESEFSFRVE
jgi:hypothetical protein